MKKIIYFLVLLFVLWVGLTMTNPTMDDYKLHVQAAVQGDSDSIFAQVGSYLISETASAFVVRKDYKILSIYVVQDPFGGEYKTLGILSLLIDL